MSTFTDRALVASGGSRGIGLAVVLGAEDVLDIFVDKS
jgi:hypothetical protein